MRVRAALVLVLVLAGCAAPAAEPAADAVMEHASDRPADPEAAPATASAAELVVVEGTSRFTGPVVCNARGVTGCVGFVGRKWGRIATNGTSAEGALTLTWEQPTGTTEGIVVDVGQDGNMIAHATGGSPLVIVLPPIPKSVHEVMVRPAAGAMTGVLVVSWRFEAPSAQQPS